MEVYRGRSRRKLISLNLGFPEIRESLYVLVSIILPDLLDQRVDDRFIAFDGLQERASAVKQHAGNGP